MLSIIYTSVTNTVCAVFLNYQIQCLLFFITLARVGGGNSTLCVVLPQNCCLSSIILKSKQGASHKLGNLRQTVVLYKTGKFLQASVAQIA